MALFSRLSASSGSAEVIRDMVVLGIGIGITMPIFSMTVLSSFPHERLGTVNSARQLFSNLGGAIAVPLMTAVLVGRFSGDMASYRLGSKLQPESLLTPEAQASIRRQFGPGAHGDALFAQFVGSVRRALAHGITDVFTIGIAFAAAAFLLTLVFPQIELTSWEGDRPARDRSRAGRAARRALVPRRRGATAARP
jgi:hypothetical protein